MNSSNIYFRGADLSAIAEEYLSGNFESIKEKFKINVEDNDEDYDTILAKKNSEEEGTCEFVVGRNSNFISIGYKLYTTPGIYGKYTPSQGSTPPHCMYCLRPITWDTIGIPIKLDITKGKKIYHMIDIFCTFDCAYTELNIRGNEGLYVNSESLLKGLYEENTKRKAKDLPSASDKRILKVFNGMVSWKTFHSYSIPYSIKHTNIFFLPVNEYVEQDY